MIAVKVIYDNGDFTTTGFNGTLDEAEKYFLGSTFNLGTERDDMHRCVKVELLEDEPPRAKQEYSWCNLPAMARLLSPQTRTRKHWRLQKRLTLASSTGSL